MKPTWLERHRDFFWWQWICNFPCQLGAHALVSWWTGKAPAIGSWAFKGFLFWISACLILWAVGYRRHRRRMDIITLMVAVDDHAAVELVRAGALKFSEYLRLTQHDD